MGGGGGLCAVWLEKWFLSESALSWGCSFPGPSTRERASAGVSCWHLWLPVSSALSLGNTGNAPCFIPCVPGQSPFYWAFSCFFYILRSRLLVILNGQKRGKVCLFHLPRREILLIYFFNFIFTLYFYPLNWIEVLREWWQRTRNVQIESHPNHGFNLRVEI